MAPDLTKSKDLLSEPRVIAAYWGLITPKACQYGIAKTDAHIPGSLADVAFEMRDACMLRDLNTPDDPTWGETVASLTGSDAGHVDPPDWITAATLAWEAGQ